MHSTAPRKVSTAVMVVTTSSEYGHAQTADRAAYRVATAGSTIMTTHLRMSYSLLGIFMVFAPFRAQIGHNTKLLMGLFQIGDPVVNDFDLLFHHRHTAGEIVVFPHLPGQLLQLRVGDSLLRVKLGLYIPGGLVAGDNYPQQRQAAGDESYDNGIGHVDLLLRYFHLPKR
nr:MAG TPA_asm: hypothetical protein [Caudoviricetes sp.]